jgi:hypothetical protein
MSEAPPLEALTDLVETWALTPWTPPVWATSSPPSAEVLRRISLKGIYIAPLRFDGSGAPDGPEIRSAVARRREPTEEDFIGYVWHRAGPQVGAVVQSLLLQAERGTKRESRSASRVSRLTPAQWRSLYRLARCLAGALANDLSQEATAFRYDITPRNLSGATRRLTGLGWRGVKALASWEGLTEAVLRRFTVGEKYARTRGRRVSGQHMTMAMRRTSLAGFPVKRAV